MVTQAKDKKVEHSQGGITTRDDVLDLGVPMLAGDPGEAVGPEDALGEGKKRGDYSNRIGGSGYHPHSVVAVPAEERKDGEPAVRVITQSHLAAEQGEEKGKKGGVTT